MITEKDLELVKKYLQRNYPVQRLKHNGKFKRAILFDSGKIYMLSDKNDKPYLKKEMVSNIEIVFGFNSEETSKLISQYLKF
jgi:hypothetical protein